VAGGKLPEMTICCTGLAVPALPALSVEQAVVASPRRIIRVIWAREIPQLPDRRSRALGWGQARVNITPSSKRIWGTSTLRVLLDDCNDRRLAYIDNGRALARRDPEVHFCVLMRLRVGTWPSN